MSEVKDIIADIEKKRATPMEDMMFDWGSIRRYDGVIYQQGVLKKAKVKGLHPKTCECLLNLADFVEANKIIKKIIVDFTDEDVDEEEPYHQIDALYTASKEPFANEEEQE